MYNTELLNQIIKKHGAENAKNFCEVVATMYDIKYNAAKSKDSLTEFDYEREWWTNAFVELTKEFKFN